MTKLLSLIYSGSAWAMAGGGGGQGGSDGASPLASLLPLVAMVVIIYFLLIRPQTKRAKDHQAMLKEIKRGDTIVTKGGIFGKVIALTDTIITVEIADKVRVRVARDAVGGLAPAEEGQQKEESKEK